MSGDKGKTYKTKNPAFSQDFFCTRGRDRTGTSVTSLVFETNASTNSATWATRQETISLVSFASAKLRTFFDMAKFFFSF